MTELDATPTYRLSATDWSLRVGVALVFAVFALEKLVGTSWNALFEEIGLGQGFRCAATPRNNASRFPPHPSARITEGSAITEKGFVPLS